MDDMINQIIGAGRVIPVLTFETPEEAIATGDVLYASGIRVFEVTLRNASALSCIASLARHLPADAFVGAGTIRTSGQIAQAREAGARFGVSPGLTPALAQAVRAADFPLLPGIATVSEAMAAAEQGFTVLKFFPAEQSGGAAFLKAVAPVLHDIRFCPTGGITLDNAPSYLALGNVPVVGGSWLVRRDASGVVDLAASADMVSRTLGALAQS